MAHAWIALLFLLREGHSLVSVTSGELGDPVTFACTFASSEYGNTRVRWYKQRPAETLTLITSMLKAAGEPTLEEGFPAARFAANFSTSVSTLTILSTVPEDEALYHCAFSTWAKDEWNATYLYFQENREHWFEVTSDQRAPNIRRADTTECGKESKRCVYRRSPTVGTSYCAVAECREVKPGNGTKVELRVDSESLPNVLILVFCVVSSASLIVTSILIYVVKKDKCDSCGAAVFTQENVVKRKLKGDADFYSAAVFKTMNAGGDEGRTRASEREKTYVAVQAFGLL